MVRWGFSVDENGLYSGDVEKHGNCVFLLFTYSGPNMTYREFKDFNGNNALIERFNGQTHIFLPQDIGVTNEDIGLSIDKHYALKKETLVDFVRGSDSIFASMPTVRFPCSDLYYSVQNDEPKFIELLKKSPQSLYPNWFIPDKIIEEVYSRLNSRK